MSCINYKIITCCGLWSNDIGIAFPFLSHITPLESPTFATNNVLPSIKAIRAVLPRIYIYNLKQLINYHKHSIINR